MYQYFCMCTIVQGMCGSCWAFAAAAQMSSYAKINNMSHALVELSPQHLVR